MFNILVINEKKEFNILFLYVIIYLLAIFMSLQFCSHFVHLEFSKVYFGIKPTFYSTDFKLDLCTKIIQPDQGEVFWS